MRFHLPFLLGAAFVALAACQTTSSDSASYVAPEPEAEPQMVADSAASDVTDAGVRAGKVGDNELPEGSRMLAKREDPTALGGAGDEKILCKRMKATGSRITTQRVCKTRREWREESEMAQRGVRQQQDSNQGQYKSF